MAGEREIAIAALGTSVGLASVLVVFMGFLLAHVWTFPTETPDKTVRRYRLAAKWGLVPTAVAVLEALACYAWLFWGTSCLYPVWTIGFVIVAVGFLAYAIIAVLMI
jgi:hypothetical protein